MANKNNNENSSMSEYSFVETAGNHKKYGYGDSDQFPASVGYIDDNGVHHSVPIGKTLDTIVVNDN